MNNFHCLVVYKFYTDNKSINFNYMLVIKKLICDVYNCTGCKIWDEFMKMYGFKLNFKYEEFSLIL